MERIVILGAGNVATHLTAALQTAGHAIAGIFSRSRQSAEALAAKSGCPPFTDIRLLPQADIYIYCVKDDVLPTLAADVAQLHPGALHLHTAGSISVNVFEGQAARYGVMYPLQTFSKERLVSFRSIPCFVEGSNDDALKTIETLARSLSEQVYVLDSEGRRYLHLSAVFANNFANHCFALAQDIIGQKTDLPPDVLLPLIRETVGKLDTMPAQAAQTGPAVRNDRNVMSAQADLLKEFPVIKAFYEKASQSIVETSQPAD